MRAVLGIDAAWTLSKPSGVALLQETADGWRSRALAPSYETFLALAAGEPVEWTGRRFAGSRPDPGALLAAAETLLAGTPVTVVSVDMPLATVPITTRRAADQLVSQAFGAKHCAVHSPNADRPGALATDLTEGFGSQGYPLATAETACGELLPALLEVYPHPAIVNLLRLETRLEYKVANARRFWPDCSPTERVSRLLANFEALHAALSTMVGGLDLPLPKEQEIRSPGHLKHLEDTLDAVVCAWVGVAYLEGEARAYGDRTAAIWIPEESGL